MFNYGGASEQYGETIYNGNIYSIIDTGLNGIMISGAYHKSLIDYIYRYIGDDEYETYEGYVITKCYSNFPPLYLMFQNYWVKVDPDEYVIDVSNAEDGSQCLLLIC